MSNRTKRGIPNRDFDRAIEQHLERTKKQQELTILTVDGFPIKTDGTQGFWALVRIAFGARRGDQRDIEFCNHIGLRITDLNNRPYWPPEAAPAALVIPGKLIPSELPHENDAERLVTTKYDKPPIATDVDKCLPIEQQPDAETKPNVEPTLEPTP